MTRQHGGRCFICLSPYWHRNLHNEKMVDKLKIMSAYELDILPLLWRNVLFKNAHFCEHVCHSWLNRSKRAMALSGTGLPMSEVADYDLIQKEALRLEEMLDGLIDGIRRRAQITDNKEYLLIFARKSGGRKQRVTWLPSGQRKIRGTWFGLAESLIEQYSANLELEDVHEREMRVIIWKHFIFAMLQHLIEYSSANPSRT
ncbi:hypothetical protein Y032_0070g453 [Ancylostoma ceylanicum]|uniref:Uncharacterized protein n=2 Tax=Ancylostoma ceylanicum TaxID=53326 RepID=A0A016TXH6_9BILA|nr:hypothetical protein Y032_0070g453 [Ancylostoma ceylanicum]